ncbi:MAG: oligoendopeptidase F [Ignavibacteriaceae bacterium]|nr:oligoendopeptidase F [Ignavibacteriaceae bacterium]
MIKTEKFFFHQPDGSVPNRDQIEEKYKWDLTQIYRNDDEWEKDFNWVSKNIKGYKKFEGKLTKSKTAILECLRFDDQVQIKLERLYLYAMLSKDSDMRVTTYQAMDDRVKNLFAKVIAASSFIKPELLKIHQGKLLRWIKSDKGLKLYEHNLKDLLRAKKHTLTYSEEKILARSLEISQTAYLAYSMFTNTDIQFPKIKDESGNEIEMSHGRFYAAMYSTNRAYRERAFKAYLKPYTENINTLTALFNGNLKNNIFLAQSRNYSSARAAALHYNNIPIAVYDNLLKNVNMNLGQLHRWASLKKRILKVKELRPFDVYVSLFENKLERKYTYEEGVSIVLKALEPLGNEYIDSLKLAFNNRWIDVYETQAKRSGAYSSGTTYGVHPYVLLNWTDLLNDVFTLAHEMGHNMHSYYTGMTQPYPYAHYTIFLAEVASTFNESLLLDYLIKNSSNENEKLFLLERYLNHITSTFYRQVMFAEFEAIVYDMAEKGTALTSENLCRIYKDIYQKYWGEEMKIDFEEEYTWARIPHFYYNFYVYQYATGLAAAEVLVKKVKQNGQHAVKKYLNFLKAGSSKYSIDILRDAGVDMKSPEPVIAVTEKMKLILDEIEKLI